jgi:hypothetical protein
VVELTGVEPATQAREVLPSGQEAASCVQNRCSAN